MYSSKNNLSHVFNLTEIFRLTILVSFIASHQVLAIGVHISREIKGAILDEITAQPIEGVIVTATWELEAMFTGSGVGMLEASEVLTDNQGRYTIPAWGPKFYADRLERDQPVIRFFKPGYIPLIIRNNTAYHPGLENDTSHLIKVPVEPGPANTGYWLYEPEDHQVKFGKIKNTFMLVPFEGSDNEYYDLLIDRYVPSLDNLESYDACMWKKAPLTFVTLDKLNRSMKLPENTAMALKYVGIPERCGNAEEYFKEYME